MKSSTRGAAKLVEIYKNKKGEKMEKEIDAGNYNMVSVNSAGAIVILNPPLAPMSKSQALVLAAWIIVLANPEEGEFERHVDAVIST